MRKPVQYFTEVHGDSTETYTVLCCLCDDNTVWELVCIRVSGIGLEAVYEYKWRFKYELPEIPQT